MRTPIDGRKVVTTAATAVPLESTSNTKVGAVVITAEADNTGTIVVGASSVVAALGDTRRGKPLEAGESMSINPGWSGDEGLVDLSKIYIDSTVNGEGVTFFALQ